MNAGGWKTCSEIHKLINSIWNNQELPESWKESIIAPIYKKGDKRDYSNYRGVSLLLTANKILSNTLLSRELWIFKKRVGDMDWNDLAQYRDRWRALMNAVMNIQVP